MKTFEQFAEEVDISRLSPEKQKAARKKAAADGIPIKGDKKRDDERKALPGSRGGALAGGALVPTKKDAADKGTAMVRQKKSTTSQASDATKPTPKKVNNNKTYSRMNTERKKGGDLALYDKGKGLRDKVAKMEREANKKAAKKVAKGVKNKVGDVLKWTKDNIKGDGKPLGNAEGDVKGPQMGIYNPK